MILNAHSYYSLRYGTLSIENLLLGLQAAGYESAVLTDINNSTGMFHFLKKGKKMGLNPIAGMEYRDGDELLFIGIAKNASGFQELNELLTARNLYGKKITATAPEFQNVFVVYPYGKKDVDQLRDFEFIGVKPKDINHLWKEGKKFLSKCVICKPVSFAQPKDFRLHCQLRAIDNNLLLSQLKKEQAGGRDEVLISKTELLLAFEQFPQIISNTKKLLEQCSFEINFKELKNKRTFLSSLNEDRAELEKLALDGAEKRYSGLHLIEAKKRIRRELEIISGKGYFSYFLIAWDVVRFSIQEGIYYVGRGSGANSVIAYCLYITDVCPIELDLYFERFLNPQREAPPDFDIDYSWKDRDTIYEYLFEKYGPKHTALLGAIGTFKDRSIIRELGKVYGLPKADIDRLVRDPASIFEKNEITRLIYSVSKQVAHFPNIRSIHAGGILISEEPICAYTALDMPPKGFPTAQFDMHIAEAINIEKLDILSQRGIGHIFECREIVKENKGEEVDVREVKKFMQDKQVALQLKSGDTIGCFYIESPAMRGLLKKLHCENYLTLVAASSIIRPGVAKSGMMKAYISRFHDPKSVEYLHPVMQEQLEETYGVMVYQEDVLKVAHHFGGLDLSDADVLRRMMSGKRNKEDTFRRLEEKYYAHCDAEGYSRELSGEVWRQIESFAGYSFSKAHSASYAVESYQSLYLKSHYPLEFMVAVINNFGGFYDTRAYVDEARREGGNIELPCVNNSRNMTSIKEKTIYLGFVHMQNLENQFKESIPEERLRNGAYQNMDDLIQRTGISLEQLIWLIRVGALRCFGKGKKELLWEAHAQLNKRPEKNTSRPLFHQQSKKFTMPSFAQDAIEDAYDEMELLNFTVSLSPFDMLCTDFRGEVMAKELTRYVGKSVRMVGNYIAQKDLRTSKGERMNFGTFTDSELGFFDTVHFPASLQRYPFQGRGMYLIKGTVTAEFDFPSLEVEKMAKLPLKPDPRGA